MSPADPVRQLSIADSDLAEALSWGERSAQLQLAAQGDRLALARCSDHA
jgi:hypothetical protein